MSGQEPTELACPLCRHEWSDCIRGSYQDFIPCPGCGEVLALAVFVGAASNPRLSQAWRKTLGWEP